MTHVLRLCLAPTALALLLACPGAQPGPAPTRTEVGPGPDDPRVVADTGDLYAARSRERVDARSPDPAAGTSPGTGRPDETNGVCRLYAPELPNPECCEHTLGFDARATLATCGFAVYVGESFHHSCGFYFLREANTPPQWLRIQNIRGDTPKQAAEEHVMVNARTSPGITAEPMPGVDDAWWVREGEYRWAFLPGWKRVRLLSWKASGCSDEAAAALVRPIIAAPEDVDGPRRDGLLPAAAPVPAPAPAG